MPRPGACADRDSPVRGDGRARATTSRRWTAQSRVDVAPTGAGRTGAAMRACAAMDELRSTPPRGALTARQPVPRAAAAATPLSAAASAAVVAATPRVQDGSGLPVLLSDEHARPLLCAEPRPVARAVAAQARVHAEVGGRRRIGPARGGWQTPQVEGAKPPGGLSVQRRGWKFRGKITLMFLDAIWP